MHLRSEDHLRIKPSGIRNAGLGLYTTEDIVVRGNRSKKVADYGGRKMKKRTVDALYSGTAAYAYCDGESPESWCRDSRRTNSSSGRYANSGRGSGLRNNARLAWSRQQQKGSIHAKKSIRKGQEILVDYGHTYWN
jgi:hypothetical protein